MKKIAFSLAALTAAVTVSSASAATLYSDGLDDLLGVTVSQGADTTVSIVDYGAGFSVPNPLTTPVIRTHVEAPRTVAGSGATTGVLFTANDSGFPGGAGAGTAANILYGAAPIAFSGTYTVSFDIYLSIGNGVTEFFPSAGSTESLLYGVGRSTTAALGRFNRTSTGDGIWGWGTVENGFGTEDHAIFQDGVELADLGDTQPGEAFPFNQAFPAPVAGGPNSAPANSWTQVDIGVLDLGNGLSRVDVAYNGIVFFQKAVLSSEANGFAMAGYGDPFGSISDQPDFQYGIVDNLVVTDTVVPEPASMALLGLGGLAMLRRRR